MKKGARGCGVGDPGAYTVLTRRCWCQAPRLSPLPSPGGGAQLHGESTGATWLLLCTARSSSGGAGRPRTPTGTSSTGSKRGTRPRDSEGRTRAPCLSREMPTGAVPRHQRGAGGQGGRQGKLLGPRESVWLYLSFPVPGQAAEHRLPKLSQTLPVSAPEPPEKAEAVTGGNRSSSGSVSPGKLKASIACREARLSLLSGRRRKG